MNVAQRAANNRPEDISRTGIDEREGERAREGEERDWLGQEESLR